MNKFSLSLTKLHIKSIGGEYLCNQFIKLSDSTEQEILIFSEDNALFLGQCTLWRAIIINESVIKDARAFKYVFWHEMGHVRQWWIYFAIPLSMFLLAGLATLAISLVSLITGLLTLNIYSIVGAFLGSLLGMALASLFCLFIRTAELDADFKAINVIGLSEFGKITHLLPAPRTRTWTNKLIKRLFYFSPEVIAKIYRRMHKDV